MGLLYVFDIHEQRLYTRTMKALKCKTLASVMYYTLYIANNIIMKALKTLGVSIYNIILYII